MRVVSWVLDVISLIELLSLAPVVLTVGIEERALRRDDDCTIIMLCLDKIR